LQGAAFCSGSFSNITNPTQTKRKPISWLSLASLSPTFCPRPPFGSLGSGACHDHQQCLCGRIYGGDERAQHLVHGHFPGVGIAVICDVEINFAVGFRIVKIGGGWYVSHVGRNWGFQVLGGQPKGERLRLPDHGPRRVRRPDRGGTKAAHRVRIWPRHAGQARGGLMKMGVMGGEFRRRWSSAVAHVRVLRSLPLAGRGDPIIYINILFKNSYI